LRLYPAGRTARDRRADLVAGGDAPVARPRPLAGAAAVRVPGAVRLGHLRRLRRRGAAGVVRRRALSADRPVPGAAEPARCGVPVRPRPGAEAALVVGGGGGADGAADRRPAAAAGP